MKPPVRNDITIVQGGTFQMVVSILNKSGQPDVDFATGAVARMQIRDEVDSDNVLLDLDSNGNGIVVSGANAQAIVEVDAAETAAMTWLRGVYDLEVEKAGVVYKAAYGNAFVMPEVTR